MEQQGRSPLDQRLRGRRIWRPILVLLVAVAAVAIPVLARMWKAAGDRGGLQPVEPFRIAGNFYYVGANASSVFLLTGPEGHVLIDGGRPATMRAVWRRCSSLRRRQSTSAGTTIVTGARSMGRGYRSSCVSSAIQFWTRTMWGGTALSLSMRNRSSGPTS
jgi:hypothetical protein